MLTHVFLSQESDDNFRQGFHRKHFKIATEAQQHFIRDSYDKFNNKFKIEQK